MCGHSIAQSGNLIHWSLPNSGGDKAIAALASGLRGVMEVLEERY